MHHISSALKRHHIVGIPLKHFTAAVQVLGVVIGTANGVFIDVRQLRFNPSGVISLLVQNGAHGMAETVARSLAIVANALNYLVNTCLLYTSDAADDLTTV